VLAVHKYAKSIPQYNIGHHKIISALDSALSSREQLRGLFVGGNFKGGVSIGDCMQNGEDFARKIADYISDL
jgi:oxygen-dependent protoporphyrinogen oxidase